MDLLFYPEENGLSYMNDQVSPTRLPQGLKMVTKLIVVQAKTSVEGNTLLLICLYPKVYHSPNMHRDDRVWCSELDSLLRLLFDS